MHYQLRWMPFKGKQVPVVLQLVNGPCPLIALCNVLLLRGKLVLRSDLHEISFEQLCSLLRAHLQREVQDLALTSKNELTVANAFAHLEEVSALLPKLENGLDVNCMFTTPTAFESTSQLALFDLAGVRLMHGWCVDPEDRETARVIGQMSYNKLVDWLTAGEEDVKRSVPLPSAAAASASASSVAASSSSAVPAVPSSASSSIAAAPSEEKSDSEAAAFASPVAPSVDAPLAALNPDAAPLSDSAASPPPPPLPPSPAASPEAAAAAMPPSADAAAVSQTVDAPVPSEAAASSIDSAPLPAATPAVESVSVVAAVSAVPTDVAPVFVPIEEKSDAAPTSAASSSSAAASTSSSAPSVAAPPFAPSASAVAASSAKSLEDQSLELAQSLFDKNIARTFLADTQSQLTVAGLSLLHQVMRDEELAVLFRNNHFSVLYKRHTRLYTLCTDWSMISAAGYIHWSFCNDIAGDQLFLDQDFKIPHPTTVAMWAQRGPAPAPPRAMAPASPVQPHHYPAAVPQQQQYPPASNPFVSHQHPQPQPYSPQPPASQLTVQQQQEQFARENGLRWNELTQNFEVLPQQSHAPHQPFQHPAPHPQYGGAQPNRHAPGVEPPKKKNSCVLQ